MNIIGVSINHKSAGIEIREAVHLNTDEILEFIPILRKNLLSEGIVISTCNRTEIFGFPKSSDVSYKQIEKALLDFKPVDNVTDENFVKYFSCSAVRHIFRVACSIDSLVIGDSQILGQVKGAIQLAEDINFTSTVSRKLFDQVLRVGKRAIRETLIGEGAVTVSYAAVQVVEKIFANLSRRSALIIGAGETAALAAIHLRDRGIGSITIANRTTGKADKLAAKIRGKSNPSCSSREKLPEFDVIVSATSSDNLMLTFEDVQKTMSKRKRAPVVLMDIAIPRDIDSKSTELRNVFYNDIDSLNSIVDENLERRRTEIPRVEQIIMDEMLAFFSWYNSLEVVPTIKSFRGFFENIINDELRKIKNKVTADDYNKLEQMSWRLMGRVLHNPTTRLKEIAERGNNLQDIANTSAVLEDLFRLNNTNNNNESKD